jgi:hypothetical protein
MLGGNANRQILVQKIINMKAQLGVKLSPYCYGESRPSDD